MVVRSERELVEAGNLLASRLERLSADSRWAHRASGLRGSLLRVIEAVEMDLKRGMEPDEQTLAQLVWLIEAGYTILVKAGREITVPDFARH